MVKLLFFRFQEKILLRRHSITFFYVRYLFEHIWVCWISVAYASSTTYLLTRLSHAGLYNYNGRQMKLFHMRWFNCG